MIVRYESVAALRAAYIASGASRSRLARSDTSWYNDESEAATLRFASEGNASLVPKAEALLAQLDTEIETPRRVWERSPAGAFASVPDVLAGLPTPMRRLTHTSDDRAPITILATTTSSGAVSSATLAKRGTVILALVIALARVRPVSLQQLTFLHGVANGETVLTAEINTSPLDLATACYVLTSAGFARRLTYNLAERLNSFNGGWPASYRASGAQRYCDALKARLVPDVSKCLLIGEAHISDAMLAEPVAWVNVQVRRFTQGEDDG